LLTNTAAQFILFLWFTKALSVLEWEAGILNHPSRIIGYLQWTIPILILEPSLNNETRNGLVSLGASFYWASAMLSLSGLSGFSLSSTYPMPFISLAVCCVTSVIIALAFLNPKARQLQIPMAIAAMVFILLAFILLLIHVLGDLAIPSPLALIIEVLNGIAFAILLLRWSLHFTLTDINDSIMVVVTTLYLSIALYMVSVSLPQPLTTALYCLLPLFSCACSLLIKDYEPKTTATRTATKHQYFSFWIVRLLYGLGIGLLVGLTNYHLVETVLNANSAYIGGIIGVSLLVAFSIARILEIKLRFEFYWLPAVPCIAMALLLLSAVFNLQESIVSLCIASTWLCFMTLSSVQIANFKERFAMSAIAIATYEKAVVLGAWAAGMLAGVWLDGWLSRIGITYPVIVGLFAGIILVATIVALSRYSHMLSAFDASKTSQQKLTISISDSCRIFAQKHNLTAREEEIVKLLYQGRSGPYIAQELVISEGTFKSHCYRIYQKLGIHKNQELIDLINIEHTEC
jgi:DNA-binding CsgD family transcriptional regulator